MLWFELGTDAEFLMYCEKSEAVNFLSNVLSEKGNILSLPLLAALPYSASAYKEISTGAARYAVFRCGYKIYTSGKIIAVILSASLSQLLGALLFCITVSFMTGYFVFFPVNLMVQRLLAACVFAMVGNISALLTKDAVSAYILPIVFVFSLSMFKSRFFVNAVYLDPITLLTADNFSVLFLSVLFLLTAILTFYFTAFEVRKYA